MDDINDLFKNLSKLIIENSLNVEIDNTLVMINENKKQELNQTITVKGIQVKKSSFGEFKIKIPRDKEVSFNLNLLRNTKLIFFILMIKLIYTINEIDNFNRNIRKLTKTKNCSCTINSVKKMIYFSINN